MPSKSKAKGNRFEYLCVQMIKDIGIEAKRAWGSNGKAMGWHEEVDILIGDDIKAQCKVRKKIANWMIPSENVDLQLIKEDRQVPYAVLPLDDFLHLLSRLKHHSLKQQR